jgi:hypothetical protein
MATDAAEMALVHRMFRRAFGEVPGLSTLSSPAMSAMRERSATTWNFSPWFCTTIIRPGVRPFSRHAQCGGHWSSAA